MTTGVAHRHSRIDADDAIAPLELGVVERGIGAREDLVDGIAGSAFADAEAAGHPDAAPARVEGLLEEPRAHAFGNLDRLRQSAVLQGKSELVAAQPSYHGPVEERRARTDADSLVPVS